RAGAVDIDAAAGALGVVGGAEQARLAGKVVEDLLLVPDVIPGGEDVDAEGQQILGDGGCDAEAAGSVLAVRNGEVDAVGRDDILQVIGDDPAPRRAEDIADKENVHLREFKLARDFTGVRRIRDSVCYRRYDVYGYKRALRRPAAVCPR